MSERFGEKTEDVRRVVRVEPGDGGVTAEPGLLLAGVDAGVTLDAGYGLVERELAVEMLKKLLVTDRVEGVEVALEDLETAQDQAQSEAHDDRRGHDTDVVDVRIDDIEVVQSRRGPEEHEGQDGAGQSAGERGGDVGPAELLRDRGRAGLLRAPTNTVFVLKEQGRYHLCLKRFQVAPSWTAATRKQVIENMAQQYADVLATHAARTPLQWFNFYDFWSNTPHG